MPGAQPEVPLSISVFQLVRTMSTPRPLTLDFIKRSLMSSLSACKEACLERTITIRLESRSLKRRRYPGSPFVLSSASGIIVYDAGIFVSDAVSLFMIEMTTIEVPLMVKLA